MARAALGSPLWGSLKKDFFDEWPTTLARRALSTAIGWLSASRERHLNVAFMASHAARIRIRSERTAAATYATG